LICPNTGSTIFFRIGRAFRSRHRRSSFASAGLVSLRSSTVSSLRVSSPTRPSTAIPSLPISTSATPRSSSHSTHGAPRRNQRLFHLHRLQIARSSCWSPWASAAMPTLTRDSCFTVASARSKSPPPFRSIRKCCCHSAQYRPEHSELSNGTSRTNLTNNLNALLKDG
jgi:hypothetical protein